MATRIGTEDNVLAMLKNLIELDFDAVEAYETAVDRISDPSSKEYLTSFQHDHERHIEELSAAVRGLGDTPPGKGDFKRVLTEGKVALASLLGDKAILRAMKSNEDDTNTAYERAAGRADVSAVVQDVLARGLADERRHRDWIVARIVQIEAGEAAGAQPGG